MSHSAQPTTIPPSPTSPPESGSAERSLKQHRLSDNLPQSPISPSYMSVATKSYVSSYGSHNADEATRSTPGSPRGASRSHQSSRLTHSLPTPAHSIAGGTSSGFDVVDEADQHRNKRQKMEREGDQMDVESISQATNHDRKNETEVLRTQGTASADVSMGDGGTTGQEEEEMDEAFLLCKSSKALHFPPSFTTCFRRFVNVLLQKSSPRDRIHNSICWHFMG
jgi:hypothetical protein